MQRNFNILVCGGRGVGKSTFISRLADSFNGASGRMIYKTDVGIIHIKLIEAIHYVAGFDATIILFDVKNPSNLPIMKDKLEGLVISVGNRFTGYSEFEPIETVLHKLVPEAKKLN